MKVDRSLFLSLVSAIAASACTPSDGVPPTTPSSTTSTSRVAPDDPAAVAPSGEGTTVTPPDTTTSAAPPPVVVADAPEAKECDGHAIAPCGEGLSTRAWCRQVVSEVAAAKRAPFVACLKSSVPAPKGAAVSCIDGSRKCAATMERCDSLSSAGDACHQKIREACDASKESIEQQQCHAKCISEVAASGAKTMAEFAVCEKKCGGPLGAVAERCEKTRTASECKAAYGQAESCAKDRDRDCASTAACGAAVRTACDSELAALRTCSEKARKP